MRPDRFVSQSPHTIGDAMVMKTRPEIRQDKILGI